MHRFIHFSSFRRYLCSRSRASNFIKEATNSSSSTVTSQMFQAKSSTSFPTYQKIVYEYLREKSYWKNIVTKLTSSSMSINQEEIEEALLTSGSSTSKIPSETLEKTKMLLPFYIATMKQRHPHPHVPNSNRLVDACDSLTSEIFEHSSYPSPSLSSIHYIHGWLHHFHPYFPRVQQLQCFGKLLQWRCREVVSHSELKNPLDPQIQIEIEDSLVHLAFLAGVGAKKNFESHEVLSQLATFCETETDESTNNNNNKTYYETLSPYHLAIICESFFKGRIRLESEKALSSILNKLCTFIQNLLEEGEDIKKEFNSSFIIVSLLKILRQVNYVDGELLRLLGELILHPGGLCDTTGDIRFITNIASAFTLPGCTLIHPRGGDGKTSSLQNILNRMDHLIISILLEEQGGVGGQQQSGERKGIAVESRLKDISKWLWTTSALGYRHSHSQAEIYIQDLNHKLDMGQFHQKPEDGVDALLALAIMGNYPETLILKILRDQGFRSAVKVNCNNRHKGRLGLFLTSLRIERKSLWRKAFTTKAEERNWFDAVTTPVTITEENTWTRSKRKVKPFHLPPGVEVEGNNGSLKPHPELLNMCMDALTHIFQGEHFRFQSPSKSKPDEDEYLRKVQVLVGYAVPFLYIPGLKITTLSPRKEVYLEVLDDVGLSSSYHHFKMRLMGKTRCNFFRVSRGQIQDLNGEELVKVLYPVAEKMHICLK